MTARHDRSGLAPFRGLRFRSGIPGGAGAVIGPPADIESSEQARAFVTGRPYSAVRLELADPDSELEFREARRLFDRWRAERVLTRDPVESFYVYDQHFIEDGRQYRRRGVLGLAPVDAPEEIVLPHENTWEENLLRRTRLLEELEASLSPILLLHDAPELQLDILLNRATASDSTFEGSDSFGETHRLWVVSDPEVVAELAVLMRGRRFLIADGHHRFEAARRYHRAKQSQETASVLALCVADYDPGVVLRPIHRVIPPAGRRNWEALAGRIEEMFDVLEIEVGEESGREMLAHLPQTATPTAALFMPDEPLRVLILKGRDTTTQLLRHHISPLRDLDATIVSDLLLGRVFDIDSTADTSEVDYSNDADAAVLSVRKGQAAAAVLMRPPTIDQVLSVASEHGRMPPKSTSFVPKPPIGLVMHDFELAAEGRA